MIDYLDLFRKLPHLEDKKVVKDWGYAPNLYHLDGKYHVSWVHCEEGDILIDFHASTPEDAIMIAFEQCKSCGYVL